MSVQDPEYQDEGECRRLLGPPVKTAATVAGAGSTREALVAAPSPTPLQLVACFTAANFLVFVDRGLPSGASLQIDAFIGESLGVPAARENAYLGILSSSFTLGYAVAAVVFGHAVHRHAPLVLIGWGVVGWMLASLLAAASGAPGLRLRSFWLFLLARVGSGVGEAAFQCIAPAMIDDVAPPGSRATWIAVFYSAIPVGTAAGYYYGARMAAADGPGWPFAFALQALAMLPFAAYCRAHRGLQLKRTAAAADEGDARDKPEGSTGVGSGSGSSSEAEADADAETAAEAAAGAGTGAVNFNADDAEAVAGAGAGDNEKPSVWDELRAVLASAVYVRIVLGYAALTAVLAGFSTFAPQILFERTDAAAPPATPERFFTSQAGAAGAFGLCIAVAGVVGTPLGGAVLDATLRARAGSGAGAGAGTKLDEAAHRASIATRQLFAVSVVGCIALVGTAALSPPLGKWAFLAGIAVGAAALLSATSVVTVAVFASVPARHRAFAVAFSTLMIHVLGDVPSPIAIGAIKDALAPQCVLPEGAAAGAGAAVAVPAACFGAAAQRGLRTATLLITVWLVWTVLAWGAAWAAAGRRERGAAPAAVHA